MGTRRDFRGHGVAAAGAVVLGISPWLPWYGFRIPAFAIDAAAQMAQRLGLSAAQAAAGADLVRHLGTLHANAWQAHNTLPAVLLVCAVIGGGLALLSLTDRAEGVARVVGLAGIVAAGLVVYHLFSPPGPSQLIHPIWGLYVALGGSLAMVAGGAIAAGADERPAQLTDLAPTPPGGGWSTSHSVPPPSSG
jgi:hypothetical protein